MYRLGREDLGLPEFQDDVPAAVVIVDANITTSSAELSQLTQPTIVAHVNSITETEVSSTNQWGRPKGSTTKFKTNHLLNIIDCINLATTTYYSEKQKYAIQNKRAPKCTLKKIIERMALEHNIDENCIKLKAITLNAFVTNGSLQSHIVNKTFVICVKPFLP
jgi:hypothetical protein